MAQPVVSTSAPPRCLDGGDVDLLHRHHRLEGTLGDNSDARKRWNEDEGTKAMTAVTMTLGK